MSFEYDLDIGELKFTSVKEFVTPLHVIGKVENHADTLTLYAKLTTDMICICCRCLKEFPKRFALETRAFLATELEDEYSEEYYLLEDGTADIDEIAVTALVLNMDQRFLCREDCKGLCPKCGRDLNEGPCGCTEEQDSRLAVLGQLLEREE